jgi:RNA polymerase sigma-70 factor (ECF subfamily)
MNEIEDKEDQVFFDQWLKGDQEGFSVLYNKYKNRVFGFLVKMTGERDVAEDVLQETFLAAYRNAFQFDRKRSFLSWLFGIAHKRTIDYFRHARVETDHQQEAADAVGSKIDSPDERWTLSTARWESWILFRGKCSC